MLISLKRVKLISCVLVFIISLFSCKGEANKSCQNTEVIAFNNEAMKYMRKKDFDKALDLFEKSLSIDDNCSSTYSYMMNIYLLKKQFNKAMVVSEKITELKPDHAESWSLSGMLHHAFGDSLVAQKYYNKGVDIYNTKIKNAKNENISDSYKLQRHQLLVLLDRGMEDEEEIKDIYRKLDKGGNNLAEFVNGSSKMNKQDLIKLFTNMNR